VIPKATFFRAEGRVIRMTLVGTLVLFVGVMVVTWVAAERARPVLLDLETGRPHAHR
jgi:hypothetical protein